MSEIRILARTRDGVVIRAGDNLDPRALTGDAVDPRLRCSGRNINPRFKSKERGNVRDRTAMVAISGGGEGEGTQFCEALREFFDASPRFERSTEAFCQRAINRPGSPENFEGWEP